MEKNSNDRAMAQKGSDMVWNPALYDGKLGMVSELGAGVMDWLAPHPGERILDLGCGTGDLARELASKGVRVEGMDASSEMVEAARRKYPDLPFFVADAQAWRPAERGIYDAVFSNAALHWMNDAAGVVEGVSQALRTGGRFAAEFGGKGNVAAVVGAAAAVLERRYGIPAGPESGPWYFPSLGEYAALLEKFGFRVERAAHFPRPTPMKDGAAGLAHWLDSFGGRLLAGVPAEDREEVYREIGERAGAKLFRDGSWHIDYVRLRVVAVKET